MYALRRSSGEHPAKHPGAQAQGERIRVAPELRLVAQHVQEICVPAQQPPGLRLERALFHGQDVQADGALRDGRWGVPVCSAEKVICSYIHQSWWRSSEIYLYFREMRIVVQVTSNDIPYPGVLHFHDDRWLHVQWYIRVFHRNNNLIDELNIGVWLHRWSILLVSQRADDNTGTCEGENNPRKEIISYFYIAY